MSNINLYTGDLVFARGKWVKDVAGVNFVDVDTDYNDFNNYEFESVTAKSVEQLIFILGKRIQEENNLNYPVHIDWREIRAKVIGSLPSTSERFDNLVLSV